MVSQRFLPEGIQVASPSPDHTAVPHREEQAREGESACPGGALLVCLQYAASLEMPPSFPLSAGLLALSAFCYSLCSLAVKLLHDDGWPLTQLMCVRLSVSACGLSMAKMRRGAPRLIPAGGRALRLFQLLLAVVGVLDLCCYFTANSMLPLGDATAIIGLYPALTTLLAWLWLGERIDRTQLITVALAAVGGILISKPQLLFGGTLGDPLGYGVAAFGCLLTSMQYLILRHPTFLGVHTLQNIFTYLVVGMPSIISAHVVSRSTTVLPSFGTGLAALTMGGLAMCGQGLLFAGAPHCQAAHATVIGSTEIVWSYIWQLALLHQPSDSLSLLGASLILISFALPLVFASRRDGFRFSSRLSEKAKMSNMDLTRLEAIDESMNDEEEWLSVPLTGDVLRERGHRDHADERVAPESF